VVLATSPVCHPFSVGYLGNLTCRDCGLTFTASWAGGAGVDEYRCANDHVVEIGSADGMLLLCRHLTRGAAR
jgi:hypothetical protein